MPESCSAERQMMIALLVMPPEYYMPLVIRFSFAIAPFFIADV